MLSSFGAENLRNRKESQYRLLDACALLQTAQQDAFSILINRLLLLLINTYNKLLLLLGKSIIKCMAICKFVHKVNINQICSEILWTSWKKM